MMRLPRRASLLVAFCLLATAATGYAVGVVGEMVQPGNRRLMDCFAQ